MIQEAGGTGRPQHSIVRLPELAEALAGEDSAIFRRIYRVDRSMGRLVVPDSARGWVQDAFGSVEAVESQSIVSVTNLVTLEETLFNSLRASRPVAVSPGNVRQIIEESRGDPFCHPEETTPEDTFGRVRGRHSITASNIAKYAPFHGLVISDEHDPLILSEERVRDYLDVGHRWALEVLKTDPAAVYYFFAWNALWSSGASIIHGHAQVSCMRGAPYARLEMLRRAAADYRAGFGSSYFEDFLRIHEAMGLALRHDGVTVAAHLAPARDKEVIIVADGLDDRLAGAVYRALDCLTGKLGTRSFNVALYMPPLGPTPEDWGGFPHVVRIVDRGDPMKRTADVGSMELFAASVVSTDPFRLIEALRERFAAQD